MIRAGEFFEAALEIDPGYVAAWVALGIARVNQTADGLRPWDEGYRMAREAILKALELDPRNAAAYGQLAWIEHAYEGNLQAAAAHAGQALALARQDQWPSEVAQVCAYRGELDEAFEWLDRSYEVEGPAGWGEFRLMLLYDNLRDDPRWQQFMERVGTSDEQLASIRLEIEMPELDR